MNQGALTREQVRSVDQIAISQFGMSGLVLMENAGRGAAERIAELALQGPVSILCGPGNNGGDGYVIARHLELLDYAVRIVSLVKLDSLSGDALANARIAQAAGILIEFVGQASGLAGRFDACGTIVECLLGTGARGAPRGHFADAVRLANQSEATRVAIDIPAGLDCDSGIASQPTFRADHTFTFVAPKVGFDLADGPEFTGEVDCVSIGVPQRLLERFGLGPIPGES
jgi:NAD(P)H-hydrate epimerase